MCELQPGLHRLLSPAAKHPDWGTDHGYPPILQGFFLPHSPNLSRTPLFHRQILIPNRQTSFSLDITDTHCPTWLASSSSAATSRCELAAPPITPPCENEAPRRWERSPTELAGQPVLTRIRNGTIESVKAIVKNLNEAQLDPNTGKDTPKCKQDGGLTLTPYRGGDCPSGSLPSACARAPQAWSRGCCSERLRQA